MNGFIVFPFFLLLNKCDIFSQKLQKTSLKVCFPDYNGDTEQDALQFILKKFEAAGQENGQENGQQRFHHILCSFDSEQVKTILEEFQKTVLQANTI